ncbi:hypothetical protein HYU95_04005 [Candidatus Daviesbacteria bacterium]|nr:hypothetical protein [Candidatus Daviesbacteria bacterium]
MVNKIFLIFLFILEIAAIICAIFVLLLSALWLDNFSPDTPLFLLIVSIVIPVILILLSAFMFLITLKFSYQKNLITRLSFLKKSLLAGYILISLAGIGFTGFIVYSLFNEAPPKLFPLDDAQATYKITKKNDFYWVSYNTTSDRNKKYVCSWESFNNKTCEWNLDQNIETFVAFSDQDLEKFTDVPLKLSGEFVQSDKQCIAGNCRNFGSFVGLKINSINLK